MTWAAASKSCDALLKRVEANDDTLIDLIILPIKTFGSADVERLAKALYHNTHLQSLSASGHAISPPSPCLSELGTAISQSTTFQRLAIGDKTFGNEGVIALCSNGSLGQLQVLDLAYKNITKEGLTVLGQACGSSSTTDLMELNLSRNPMGNDGISAFCEAAAGNVTPSQSLQTLSLMECEISAEGMEALSKWVVQTGCTTLGLSSNPLGSASSLSNLLHQGNIQALHLASCELGDDGVKNLCDAVVVKSRESCCTKVLVLSDNDIGDEGVKALASSLQHWKALTDLFLAQNSISSDGMSALATALQESTSTLQSLDVSKTNCGVAGAVSLVSACNTASLKKLRLFGNQLGSDGFTALADLLPTCQLEELDLGGNDAEAPAVMALLEPLLTTAVDPLPLKILEIGGNSTSMEVEALVKRILEVHPGLDIARDKPRQKNDEIS